MDGNALVKEVLNGIIKGIAKEIPAQKKKEQKRKHHIFMILEGKDEEIDSLRKFKEDDVDVSIILSKEKQERIKKDLLKNRIYLKEIYTEENDRFIEKMDMLWIPIFNQNMAAKLRLGIQDTIDLFAIWQALWYGKKVIANKKYLQYCNGKDTKNVYLKKIVQENIQFLEKMGVKWSNDTDFLKEIKGMNAYEERQKEKRKIITKKDILGLVGKTNEFYLSKDSIITPLAKDIAKEKNILIIKDG